MKRKILVNTQERVNEIFSTFEKTQNLFTLKKSSKDDSAGSSEIEFEFEDRYYQFLVDKIEMLGYSKGELAE